MNAEETTKSTWIIKSFLILSIGGTLAVSLLGFGLVAYFSKTLPKIITVADYRPLTVTRLIGKGPAGDVEVGEFFKERRYIIPYEKIPEVVIRAFISAEDDRFFDHLGVNFLSIIRAGIANFRAGHVVQGGSTITQQVAKSLLLTSEKSLERKIKELILANRIERNLTKQQILYLYLNQIYLGHGAYGIQAASRTYFRKDVSQLNLAEAALLAGMPQAPGKYSPLLNPKKAKERQVYVLRRMLENHYIKQGEMDQAAASPVPIYHDENLNNKYSPYYVEYVRKYLLEKYGEKALYEDGLTVFLPMNVALAQVAEKGVRTGLLEVDKRIGYRGPLQNLKSEQEIEKFAFDYQHKLVEKKVGYQLLLQDGSLDLLGAVAHAGIQSDRDLLEPGNLYQAVITGFDLHKKQIRVLIGTIKGVLPLEKMKWARLAAEDLNPLATRPPQQDGPFRNFRTGDVILVSLASESHSDTHEAKPLFTSEPKSKEVTVALEQEPILQGALFSMETQTGNVLSMVGGYSFAQSEFNRAVQASRQPGSAFKPIIYASALEKGYTPASIIVDSPIVFKESDGSASWKPNNFEEKFYGDTTFRQALIKSRNIPTVKIVQAVQVPYVIDYARRLGMTGQFNSDLSLSLGSASTNLMDLTRVYALFPRLGRKVDAAFLTKVVDRDGRIVEQSTPQPPFNLGESTEPANVGSTSGATPLPTPEVGGATVFPHYPLPDDPKQVLDPRVAYVMTHLMKEVVTFGTGQKAKDLGRVSAGKTGTTNNSVDAWFIGYTPHIVTGVWVGFDNQKSIGPSETGARAALPIWLSYMKEAVRTFPDIDFAVPPGIAFASIDANSGKIAKPNSSNAIKEAFIAGTEPTGQNNSGQEGSEPQNDFYKEDKE